MQNTATTSLLIELGTAELPANQLSQLSQQLYDNVTRTLTQAGIVFVSAQQFATPRRLAILVKGVPEQLADQVINKRGPALTAAFDANGNPTAAALGFARSCGVEMQQLEKITTDKGAWLCYEEKKSGGNVRELLPNLLTQALQKFNIKKPMRWGSHDFLFIRPVHWLLALFGRDLIPFHAFNCQSDKFTYGHRFMQPQPIKLANAEEYETALERRGFVCADLSERKKIIQLEMQQLSDTMDCDVVFDQSLLNEVCGLVEWPVALFCSFDREFLRVPAEALMTSMQHHQKCFALKDKQGRLLPHFLMISNVMSLDPDQIVKGNERVMRARLNDAAFFYDSDCRIPSSARLQKLSHVTFQTGLGSLADKAQRLEKLARFIAACLNFAEPTLAERAGLLCKTDLVSSMVGEFPELQGVMGYYYALHDNENPALALAIKEHYLPRFAEDALPTSALGNIIALADKIDTLIGLISSKGTPSADKDPFGLRRAALGVLRIAIALNARLNLIDILSHGCMLYDTLITAKMDEVRSFIEERQLHLLREQQLPIEIYHSLRAYYQTHQLLLPDDFMQRARALQAFLNYENVPQLIMANKRVANIIQKNKITTQQPIDETLFADSAERQLWQHLNELIKPLQEHTTAQHFEQALALLATLYQPLDAFFSAVMVECDDLAIRHNRLALLFATHHALVSVAHLEHLQGLTQVK